MKILSLLVALIFVSSIFAAESDVLVLTKDNFDTTVNNADIILVEFYAPWCGHCKKLAPEYAIAAEKLKKNDPPVLLANVDATVDGELASRFGVKGYPTLKIFRRGSVSDYGGPRDANGIVSYMEKQAGASAKPLASADAVTAFIEAGNDKRDLSIVGFFSNKDSSASKNFQRVADSLRDHFRFAIVQSADVAQKLGQKDNTVVIFKDTDDKTVVYGGAETVEALTSWVWDLSVPSVGELTKDNLIRYTRKNLPILKIFIDTVWTGPNLKRTKYYLNRLKKVAEEVGKKLSFVLVNKKDFTDELSKFGVDTKQEAGVAIDDFANSLKYRFTHDFSVDKLVQFGKDFLSGKLKPYIKSEPVPAKQDGPVTVVVGETFNNIVMDPTKDVMIEIYAPWCGHCKKLEPIYNELAQKLNKDVSNVVIAKMDGTVNDSPHAKYQAKGYPTILFAPANNKDNPIAFSGEREVQAMYDWIKSKSSAWTPKKDEL